jgi:hypothetical protein
MDHLGFDKFMVMGFCIGGPFIWNLLKRAPIRVVAGSSAPYPYPAAARIVGGTATLPRIREGWLNLSVESDNGATFSFTVPVSSERELSARLPPGNR